MYTERDKYAEEEYLKEVSFAEGLEKGLKQGMEQGRQEGLDEGREEKALEIAKKMLLLGLSDEQIYTATGLTVEQVQKLR